MQIGLICSALTPDVKMRRQQANLCLYCGGTVHFLRNCPVRPSKSTLPYPVYFQVSGFFPARIIPFISLYVEEGEVKLQAIIDSGARSCFLDVTLARKLQISFKFKKQGGVFWL